MFAYGTSTHCPSPSNRQAWNGQRMQPSSTRAAVAEMRAQVRAERVEHARRAVAVAEEHEVPAEVLQRHAPPSTASSSLYATWNQPFGNGGHREAVAGRRLGAWPRPAFVVESWS